MRKNVWTRCQAGCTDQDLSSSGTRLTNVADIGAKDRGVTPQKVGDLIYVRFQFERSLSLTRTGWYESVVSSSSVPAKQS